MRTLFVPPVSADDDRSAIVRMLHIIGWTIIAAISLAALLEVFAQPANLSRWAGIFLVVDSLCLLVLWLSRHGCVHEASLLFVAGLWGAITVLSFTSGGINAPAVGAFPLLVFIAGLLLGARTGILTAAVCAATGLGLVYTQEAGVLPTSAVQYTLPGLWVVNALLISFAIGLQYLATYTVQNALQQARKQLAERQRAEETTRLSEGRLRALFQAMDDVVIVFDSDGRYLEIAPTRRELARPRAELLGKTVTELFPPEQAELFLDQIHRTLADNEPLNEEYQLLIGEPRRWFSGTFSRMSENRVLVVARDITLRKHAQQARAESERQLSLIYTHVSDIIFYLAVEAGPRYRYVTVNRAFLETAGLSEAQVVGQLVQQVLPESAHALVLHQYAEAIRTRRAVRWEEVSRSPSGKKYGEVSVTPVMNSDGQCTHLIGVVHDITERKQSEDALRESERRYREVYEHTSDGIFLIDVTADGRFRVAGFNPAHKRATGLTDAEYGKYVGENPSSETDQYLAANYRRCLTAGEPLHFEEQLQMPKGRVDFHTTLVPVGYASGRVYRILGIARDITEQKREEKARAQRLARAETLDAVSKALANVGLNYQAALDVVAERVSQMLGGLCVVRLLSDDGQWLHVSAVHHPDAAIADNARRLLGAAPLPASGGTNGRVLEKGQALLSADIHADGVQATFSAEQRLIADQFQAHSILIVPLRAQQSIIGTVSLGQNDPGKPYTPEDEVFLQEIADRAALVITNARLYRDNLRQSEMLRQANADLEQRVAERTLELADLYNHAPCGYHSLDAEGRCVQVNDTELAMLGYTRAEMLGKPFAQVLTPPGADIFAAQFAALRERGSQDSVELEAARKDGRALPVVITMAAVRGPQRELQFARATLIDDTQRKAADEQIRKLNVELETRAERLEVINKELESFSYSVSHDLKAPLRGIDGYSQLLLADYRDKLDEEGRFFVETIRSATAQMAQLIEDLLSYSRLERRELTASPVDVPRLVDQIIAGYRDEIEARHVALNVSLPPVIVHADPEGLGIALRNILDNAFKFTRQTTEPVITLEAQETPATVLLRIRDNGIGFDMQYHERIFEIFQRLHRAEDYPGTGIGLAIVRKAMQRMGGRVWAESARGAGTTFTLEIPK
jgi:PAS domain S-box-containing protein